MIKHRRYAFVITGIAVLFVFQYLNITSNHEAGEPNAVSSRGGDIASRSHFLEIIKEKDAQISSLIATLSQQQQQQQQPDADTDTDTEKSATVLGSFVSVQKKKEFESLLCRDGIVQLGNCCHISCGSHCGYEKGSRSLSSNDCLASAITRQCKSPTDLFCRMDISYPLEILAYTFSNPGQKVNFYDHHVIKVNNFRNASLTPGNEPEAIPKLVKKEKALGKYLLFSTKIPVGIIINKERGLDWFRFKGLNSLEMFDNKQAFKEWVASIGLGKFMVDDYASDSRIVFPAMLKATAATSAGAGVRIAYDYDHYIQLLEKYFPGVVRQAKQENQKDYLKFVNENNAKKDVPYFMEEWLGSDPYEFCVHVTALEGRLIHALCHKYSMPYGGVVKGGSWRPFRTERLPCDSNIIEFSRVMLEKSGYHGVGCLNVKINPQGELKIFEFNARMCGSAIKTQSMFVELICSLQHDPTLCASPALLLGYTAYDWRALAHYQRYDYAPR